MSFFSRVGVRIQFALIALLLTALVVGKVYIMRHPQLCEGLSPKLANICLGR